MTTDNFTQLNRVQTNEPTHKEGTDLAIVSLDVKCFVEWSDKIIDDFDPESGDVEYGEGWAMEVIPNQKFVYQGQPYVRYGSLFQGANKSLTTDELIDLIKEWGEPKQLTEPRSMLKTWPQFEKVQEEVGEIARSIVHNDREELIDAIGDTFVTLVLLSEQNNLNIKDCIDAAYNVIKNRTGKTVDGKFVKDK